MSFTLVPAFVLLAFAAAEASTTSTSSTQPPTEPPPAHEPSEDARGHRFSFAAVPTLTFNTDEGFGTGGVGTLYHHHAGVEPYRDALTLNAFISSKLVQSHALTWDAIRPFDLAGRFYARVGYYSTLTQNYCGVGNAVTCAPGDAAAAVDDLHVKNDDERAELVRHYHQMRFIKPYATVLARPWLRDKPGRVELLLGWRGFLMIPGDLSERTPYPTSVYAADHPDGEAGFSSVPFVGVAVDDRDDEIFPTRGYFFESSVRGAHPWLGATWTYAGANASVSSFFSVSKQPRAVLATRFLADAIVGDPSTEEMARIGGTLDWIAFGGHVLGRGIRERRYIGKLKAIGQSELRGQFLDFDAWGEHFSFGAALFSDVGWIGYDVRDLRGAPLKLLATAGVSWRILWNERFAIRWDLATSPNEPEGPGFYIIVGQVF